MTEVISFKPRLEQHGYVSPGNDFVPPFWVGLGLPSGTGTITHLFAADTIYTQVYNFDLTYESVTGLAVDKPIFYTQSSQNLFYTLTLPTTLTSTNSNLGVKYHTNPEHELWSGSLHPASITETDSQTIETSIAASSDWWVLNGSTYDLTIPLDFNTEYGTRPAVSIRHLIANRKWNGRLILTFPSSGQTWGITFDASTYVSGFMTGQYIPQFTGWSGRPASRGRPVRDMKTGLPAFAEDLQEDGYLPGIWTQNRSWDSDDPRNRTTTEFPSGESQKTDDVPV